MTDGRRGPTEIVLTAANRGQALAALRAVEGDARIAEAIRGDAGRRLLVTPDAGGRRVGSGVATLAALRIVAERVRRIRDRDPRMLRDAAGIGELLSGRTIAIVHSGGDSRRLPAYAAEGKIFGPMPTALDEIATPTLLERIVGDLDEITTPRDGGVLVASGDVWLDVADAGLRFTGDHLELVAFLADPARGSRHGVLVPGIDDRVEACLQKPSPDAAREHGAFDADGKVLLDTGLLFVPIEVAASWLARAIECGVLDPGGPPLDLYADLLPATARRWSERPRSDDRAAMFLHRVRASEVGGGLRVRRLERCAFRHAGSTRELLQEATSAGGGSFRRDEIVREDSKIAEGAYLDRCGDVAVRLARGSMLVGVSMDPGVPIELPENRGLVVVPIRGGDHAAIAFAIEDDFKSTRDGGGTLLGRPLEILPESCWSGEASDASLWTARIWPVGELESVVRRALACIADPGRLAEVVGKVRSAAEIFAEADHRRLVSSRRRLRFDASIRRAERATSPIEAARFARAAAEAAPDESRREGWRRRAFDSVARSVAVSELQRAPPPSSRPAKIADRVVLHAPVRIDLAGGWTDTPPICLERGGAVVNVAIEIDGRAPLEASVERLEAPVVRIESRDLGRSAEFTTLESLWRPGDPRDPDDWALLPRTAVAVSGLLEAGGSGALEARLERLGGGFELRIASTLPKGSGLGTSSMLGALALAALRRSVGLGSDRPGLIASTSSLEQRMGTAGGWQDQAGGITGGAKFLQTGPGEVQIPTETTLEMPESFWRNRVIVHSTGQQRLARHILQQVVWRWLGGGRRVVGIVDRIHATAHRLREAIDRRDDEAIAGSIGEAWRLKCQLDPGSTTPEIEAMVEPIADELSAWTLPGAGGGGFLMLVARNAAAAERLRDRCRREPLHRGGRIHEASIAEIGIRDAAAASPERD